MSNPIQVPPDDVGTYKLKNKDIALIITTLGQLPYETSAGLIGELQVQFKAQYSKPKALIKLPPKKKKGVKNGK